MFFIKLFNFLQGYVVIIIDGAFPERFLNICARRSIYLWNVRRLDKLSLRANVSIAGFRLMPDIAKKSRCRVRIKSRMGLPFFIHRHRKRKAFAAGALIFAAALLVLSRFIWVVDVIGNDVVESARIVAALNGAGLKTGILKSGVDEYALQNILMTEIDEIAWISVQIKGTTAHVEVKERDPKPEIFPKDEPCDIVALRDAVIESIDALNGDRLVTAGEIVRRGQLLVSGVLESENAGIRFVHSDAEITARTWYEFAEEIPRFEEVRTPTGRSKSKNILKILNFNIKFFINDGISYENYDRISMVKKFSIGKSFVLPISLHLDKYAEVQVEQREIDRAVALKTAEGNAFANVKGKLIVKTDAVERDGALLVTYECLEDIGVKRTVAREENTSYGEDIGG